MNPIDDLKHEHSAIEGALQILEKISERIQEPAAAADAARLVDFFKTFVDTCHHGKEEQALFPQLETLGVSRRGGPIGVMLDEHEQGRAFIRGMRAALGSPGDGNGVQAAQFRQHAAAYAGLLRLHIQKENQVLFAIADKRLSDIRRQNLAKEFDRIEREVVGEGKHEEFHRMLDELSARYLR